MDKNDPAWKHAEAAQATLNGGTDDDRQVQLACGLINGAFEFLEARFSVFYEFILQGRLASGEASNPHKRFVISVDVRAGRKHNFVSLKRCQSDAIAHKAVQLAELSNEIVLNDKVFIRGRLAFGDGSVESRIEGKSL